ncbi:MAG: hypothetical protein HRT45_09750 [Bdellovibrionales bacterium]|nr:hypothetical protein [Bdellovibrionales bacterium]
MIKSLIVAASVFVGLTANAQNITHVYDAVRGEFNGDGYSDLAYIVDNPNSEEYFELVIQLSTGERHGDRYLAAHSTNLIYKVAGKFFSVGEPSLTIRKFDNKPDSLNIHSEHFGAGRSKWAQDVVVAYREGQFMFAGMDYSEYDSLQEYDPMNCSFNTLNGRKNYQNKAGVEIKGVAIQNQGVVRKSIDNLVENDVINLITSECQPN